MASATLSSDRSRFLIAEAANISFRFQEWSGFSRPDRVSVAAAEGFIVLVFDAFSVVSVDVLHRYEGTKRRGIWP